MARCRAALESAGIGVADERELVHAYMVGAWWAAALACRRTCTCPDRCAAARLPGRRRPAARPADPADPGPRGWKLSCICRDGPMRPATSHRPPCTSSPHARSRGRKAPCWPWGSASRSSAPRSTAWRTLGEDRGVLVSPEDPRALAGALSRVLAGERPDPALGRACARQFTPAQRPRYRPAPTASCSPAAPEPGSQARHGLETSAFWCRSWSWAAVLTEMAAPTGRQVTALSHSSERTAEPAPGTSASSRDDGRSARLPLVTARDGSSVRKGADPPSPCSSGYCHRSLAVAAQIGRHLSCLRTSTWPAAAGLVPGWSGRPSEC